MPETFTRELLGWYAHNARDFPWRGQTDPYAIWISEIMLQQTRVETVIPYYERWMERFPSVEALASASQQEVLSLWEGLGYYSRARNLLRAARMIVQDYGGRLPSSAAELQRLPGIGRYSAGAIASLAFGQDEPTVDGNIRRVLARLFDISLPARSPAGERRVWELAASHLPAGQAGNYNQALMGLGATICTPRAPKCPQCPLARFCQAYALGLQEERPVRAARAEQPHHTVATAVIHQAGQVLIAQRPPEGLLGGLWEFPGGKREPGEDLIGCLQREIKEELGVQVRVGGKLGVYEHAYTHFRITLHAFHCTLLNGGQPQALEHTALHWVAPAELETYPMGKIDRQIASQLVEGG